MYQNHLFRENQVFVFKRGLRFIEKGRPLKALEQFERILSNSIFDVSHYNLDYYVGRCHFELCHFDVAMQYLQKAIDLKPDCPEIRFYWAACLHQTGDPAQCHLWFLRINSQINSLKPILSKVRKSIVEFYFEQNETKKCVEFCSIVNDSNEANVQILSRVADILMAYEMYDQALISLLQLSSRLKTEKHFELAVCYIKQAQSTLALDHFSKIDPEDPRYNTAIFQIAAITFELQKFDVSLNIYKKCLHETPYTVDSYKGIIGCLIELNQLKAANDLLKITLDRFPSELSFYHFKANALLLENKVEDAIVFLRKTSCIFPQDKISNQILMEHYSNNKDYKQALIYLTRCQKLNNALSEQSENISVEKENLSNEVAHRIWTEMEKMIPRKVSEDSNYSDTSYSTLNVQSFGSRLDKYPMHSAWKLVQSFKNVAGSINNLSVTRFDLKDKNLKTRGSFAPRPSINKSIFMHSLRCEPLKAFSLEVSFENPKTKSKLISYVSILEQLLKFFFDDRKEVISDSESPLFYQSNLIFRYILECAFILDYKQHAMNCDVLFEETETNPSGKYTIDNGLRLITPKTFIRNLKRNFNCILTFDSDLLLFLRIIAQNMAKRKQDIITRDHLMPRQLAYLQNLQKFILRSIKSKDPRDENRSDRINFFNCLNLLMFFNRNQTSINQFAVVHFFAFCMAMARNTFSSNTSDPANLLDEIVNAFNSETDYEV